MFEGFYVFGANFNLPIMETFNAVCTINYVYMAKYRTNILAIWSH